MSFWLDVRVDACVRELPVWSLEKRCMTFWDYRLETHTVSASVPTLLLETGLEPQRADQTRPTANHIATLSFINNKITHSHRTRALRPYRALFPGRNSHSLPSALRPSPLPRCPRGSPHLRPPPISPKLAHRKPPLLIHKSHPSCPPKPRAHNLPMVAPHHVHITMAAAAGLSLWNKRQPLSG